ncbi:hypothetical protein [Embleya scabrispora]|uniref:hypothetical protein n=1 Tax=Embleya scabrispora TaxID=159449 RepID=UPI000380FE4B|nr:hypothetical protein [Embleya scabrispora]MYS86615.1 hypothetical protein [Streptomyces sp. SID5474]
MSRALTARYSTLITAAPDDPTKRALREQRRAYAVELARLDAREHATIDRILDTCPARLDPARDEDR